MQSEQVSFPSAIEDVYSFRWVDDNGPLVSSLLSKNSKEWSL